jgi:hypothetical protein
MNWLYKISSIRELIPRIFVEAAMLRIFSFLLVDPYTDTLQRLLQSTNGIGHPLISAYARSYIVKKGLETDRSAAHGGRGRTMQEKLKEKEIFRKNFDDFIFQLTNAKSDSVCRFILPA